ncbi:hypothetical protein B7463_g5450, partial [Scytalidium lignicola]
MSDTITLDIFRGTPEGDLTVEKTTHTLGYGEIYIETTHSGLCGTDLHSLSRGGILGHEGIGIVRQIGPGVSTGVKVGDRVGFGYTHKVCGNCEHCLSGRDQYCTARVDFSRNTDNMGSISSGVVWAANMVFPIPDGYDSADAAPLLCAGSTVFTVLTGPEVKSTDRIGIMGIGGLGHLAIKLAAAMGHEVVVLSTSESKRQEALQFGATEFYVYNSEIVPQDFKPIKHLLLCGNTPSKNFNSIIDLLATNGTIYPLTVSAENIPIRLGRLNGLGACIKGSLTGSRHTTHELLKFVALHKIKPTIMKFPMTAHGIRDAIDTLKSGKMRYRGVLFNNAKREPSRRSTMSDQQEPRDSVIDETPISPVGASRARQNSLEKHLQHRPDPQDLKHRHILLDTNAAPALQSVQLELERQRVTDSLKKGLEHRPERKELIDRNILPDSTVAPAIQGHQRELEKHMRADSLNEKIQHRPKVEDLVKGGVLKEDPTSPVENADALYEERIEEEYAKREGGA